jgi:hypothetical protein
MTTARGRRPAPIALVAILALMTCSLVLAPTPLRPSLPPSPPLPRPPRPEPQPPRLKPRRGSRIT